MVLHSPGTWGNNPTFIVAQIVAGISGISLGYALKTFAGWADFSLLAAPALLVRKPDGKYRLVIDYRKLNQLTIKDQYALPTAESVFN